jgi:hypothetical protein
VKVNGVYGYVDETGNFAIEPQYQNAWSFVRGAALIKSNGLYGMIDKQGDAILQPVWDSVIPFSASCFIFGKKGKYGFAAHGTGEELLPAAYEQVYFYTNSLCVVQSGFQLGVVNAEGKLVCPPQLQDLKEMTGALALVIQSDTSDKEDMLEALLNDSKRSKYGLLNKKGELVLPVEYNEIFSDEKNEWYYPFQQSDTSLTHQSKRQTIFDEQHQPPMTGKYGIVDSLGRLIVKPEFDEQPVFGDGLFRIMKNKKYGFVDSKGKISIPLQYDYVTPFHEGYAVATIQQRSTVIDKNGKQIGIVQPNTTQLYKVSCGRIRFKSTNGRYGYLNLDGTVVIQPSFEVADDFVFNRAIVERNGEYQLIDKSGEVKNTECWDFIFNLGEGYFQVRKKDDTLGATERLIQQFSQTTVRAQQLGVIDTNGKISLPVVFNEIFHLQSNYFAVESNGLNGCYKKTGELVYSPKSATPVYFFNGRAEIRETGGYGLIDTTGRYILSAQFDSIGILYKGYATITQKGLYGFIDSLGNVVMQPKYEQLQPLVNGVAVFAEKSKYGYVSLKGDVLFPAKFEEASPLIDPDRSTYD